MSIDNDELTVYSTGGHFPSVSVTGPECGQMCEHCKGEHLKRMTDARGARNLFRIVDDLLSADAEGLLVSGGCDINGSVPIVREIDAIRYASDNGLKVNVHTGFIGKEDAERLVAAGVKAFSVDVHQDPDVIKNILHLDAGKDAYSGTLDNIISAGGRPVAHLTVGLGKEDLLRSAELIKRKGLDEAVLIALVPTKGTMTEDSPAAEEEILEAVKELTDMGIRITLGCMRPRIYRDLERKCIELGVRGIANPARGTVRWAKEKGMSIVEIRTCCCFTR